MKLDILVLAAHPDDAELSCAGTILKHIQDGRKVGVADLTRGELGTRGTPEIRAKEAEKASRILGLHARRNLDLGDGFFENTRPNQIRIIEVIRKYQPDIVLCNTLEDRHPDHGRAGKLVSDACFLSGLVKILTTDDGKTQAPWRPRSVYHYIQDKYIKPDFLVDITDYMDKKMEAIKAFKSQFYNPESQEPETYISSEQFMEAILARGREMGKAIHARYAEGFTADRVIGVENLFDLR